jgi:hypothetical protein
MPDISMCANGDCPSKNECYRSVAKPGMYQSYANFEIEEGETKCEYFWPLYETLVVSNKSK